MKRRVMLLTIQQVGEFEPSGTTEDPTGRLLAKVKIASTPHHMEAIAVAWENDAGERIDPNSDEYEAGEVYRQVAADDEWQGMLDEYYNAAGGDGYWHTIEIEGREYVLCITPYCQ